MEAASSRRAFFRVFWDISLHAASETITTSKALSNSVYVCEHCAPIPDDTIIARASNKRTVVHRETCQLLSKRAFWPKKFPAAWNTSIQHRFPARLRVKAFHQPDTHNRIRVAIRQTGAAFVTMSVGPPAGDGLEMLEILLEVADGAMLTAVETGLGKLRDIAIVTRI